MLISTKNRDHILFSSYILSKKNQYLKQKSKTIRWGRYSEMTEKWGANVQVSMSASIFILISWKTVDLEHCYCEPVENLSHSRFQYSNSPEGNQRHEIEFILSHIFCLYGDCSKQVPSGNYLCLTLISCAIIDTHIHFFCPQ